MTIIDSARANRQRLSTIFFILTNVLALSIQIAPDNPALSYIGRFDLSNPTRPAFQWPMTTIATQFQCQEPTRVELQFESSDFYTSLAAYIAGNKVAHEFLPKGVHNVSVSLPAGTSVLTVEKETEDFSPNPAIPFSFMQTASSEPVYFTGMTIVGSCNLVKLPEKQRRVEVIGDSISCGFGNTNKPKSCQNERGWTSCQNEVIYNFVPWAHNRNLVVYNVTSAHNSYASQLARLFDAELHLECISGIGMCKNAIDVAVKSSSLNMSLYFDRTLPYKKTGGPVAWDYTQWHPDLLVINLGTNDYDESPIAPSEADFFNQYLKFVVRLMKRYDAKQTKVLLVCGPMTNKQCSNVQKVADTLKKENGITIAFVETSVDGTPGNLSGIMNHPTEADDTQMLHQIRPVVESLMGWTVDPAPVNTILV